MTINRLNQGTTNQVLVKAISGQTTNLLELQDSSGNVVSSIGPTGALGGTVSQPQGLVHIETRTVSATTSEFFDGVFSADYDDYFIKAEIICSSNNDLNFRLRANGTPDSANEYGRQTLQSSGSTALALRSTVTTSGRFMSSIIANNRNAITSNFFSPFLAQATSVISDMVIRSDSGSNIFGAIHYIGHNVVSSFDGIEFNLAAAGTMTGTISIYGYAKA